MAKVDRDVNLKRSWDDELEAELQEALEGFDAASLTARKPRVASGVSSSPTKAEEGGEGGRGGVRKARVVAIRGASVFVDMGTKSEGILPLEQFEASPPAVGMVLDVIVDRYDAKEGLLRVALPNAAIEATWQNLRKGVVIDVRVTKALDKGLEVEASGIRGFMPISQVDLDRVEDLKPYVNQRYRVMVIEVNARERNLLVSRRDFLEKERAALREKTWKEIEEGQTRTGKVRSLKPFGAFVDLGGVDGLVPIGEMAWGRIKHPSEVVSLGQEVEVKILKLDRALNKVTLGLKQLKASPWDDIEDQFPVGSRIKGKVTKVIDKLGAFVEIAPGVEGLVHISEMSFKRVYRVSDFATEGAEVEVKILKYDPETHKIGLSMKQDKAAPVIEAESEDDEDAVPVVKPERKIPLKGGLGDRDPNPFSRMPK
jgi:small subunit ribosomal protein S1